MAMVINSNIASLNAQRHLQNSRAEMETSMERLASGERINSAVDDAAGGAIAARMETRVSGMEQLIRNVNDGVSMVQIAESAMGEVNNMLQRMRDLAIQSTNSTLNATDRQTLQLEVDQLVEEINTIAATTQFNGQNILAGTGVTNSIQSGLNAGEAVSFQIGGVSASKLGLSGGISGQLLSGRISTGASTVASDVVLNGVELGTFAASTTAAGHADVINAKAGITGVTAVASNRVEGRSVGLGDLAIGEFTMTGALGAVTFSSSSSLTNLADKINEQTDVLAEVTSDGRLILSNTTGEDITIAGAGVTTAGFEAAATYKGFLSLKNNDGSTNAITLGLSDETTSTSADMVALGFNAISSTGSITGGAVPGTTAAQDGDTAADEAITINGVSIGAVGIESNNTTGGASAAQYVSAINAVTDQTNVTATALTEVIITLDDDVDTTTASTSDTTFAINGVEVIWAADDSADTVVAAMNDAVGSLGIVAESLADGTVKLSSTTGLDITLEGTLFTADADTLERTKGKLTLTHNDGGNIQIGSLATTDALRAAAAAKAGLMLSNSYDTDGGGLNISTASGADSALATLDDAIVLLSNNRAEMGAYLKRFEAETSNLQVAVEKTAAALSAIMDADYAVESANLAKAQVLQQAGTAMLAQANASTQNVLSLLK
jgi:flagellin